MKLGKMIQMREQETGHSVFGPSQMQRILACPASVVEGLKASVEPTSVYAARGTFLHECMGEILELADKSDTITGKHKDVEHWIDGHTYFGHDETPPEGLFKVEEAEALRDCFEYQDKIANKLGGLVVHGIELEVDLSSWDLSQVRGTADRTLASVKDKHCHVIDWKFGRGVQVYADMNEQLLCYGAGVVGHPTKYDKLTIHVAQPLLNHFDEFTISIDDLKDWIFNTLEPGLKEAVNPLAEYNPGKKQCKFCPARMQCTARHELRNEEALDVFQAANNLNKDTVSLKDLVAFFHKYQAVRQYGEEIQKHLLKQGLAGKPIPTMKVVNGRVSRKWKDEAEALAFLKMCGVEKPNMYAPAKFITVAQAEKLDRGFKGDDEFKSLVNVVPGKPQLVDESDKRDAYTPVPEAIKAFEDV